MVLGCLMNVSVPHDYHLSHCRLEVGEDAVKAVYKLSQDLRIQPATVACSEFLIDSLTPDNCLGITPPSIFVPVKQSYFPPRHCVHFRPFVQARGLQADMEGAEMKTDC